MTDPLTQVNDATHGLMSAYTEFYNAAVDASVTTDEFEHKYQALEQAKAIMQATVKSGVETMVERAHKQCSMCGRSYLPDRTPYRPYKCPECAVVSIRRSKQRSFERNKSRWASTRNRFIKD